MPRKRPTHRVGERSRRRFRGSGSVASFRRRRSAARCPADHRVRGSASRSVIIRWSSVISSSTPGWVIGGHHAPGVRKRGERTTSLRECLDRVHVQVVCSDTSGHSDRDQIDDRGHPRAWRSGARIEPLLSRLPPVRTVLGQFGSVDESDRNTVAGSSAHGASLHRPRAGAVVGEARGDRDHCRGRSPTPSLRRMIWRATDGRRQLVVDDVVVADRSAESTFEWSHPAAVRGWSDHQLGYVELRRAGLRDVGCCIDSDERDRPLAEPRGAVATRRHGHEHPATRSALCAEPSRDGRP